MPIKRAGALVLFIWCLAVRSSISVTPPVFYANVGDTVVLQCNNAGTGSFACFSTYTFQSMTHPMVMLNQSMKYQVNMGSITITNVQATDAGFYACSQNCWQMKSDLISYYLQPMSEFELSFSMVHVLQQSDEFSKIFQPWVSQWTLPDSGVRFLPSRATI